MRRNTLPPQDGYIDQAAKQINASLDTVSVENLLIIFHTALDDMNAAILDARVHDQLTTSFIDNRIRPDLGYMLFSLGEQQNTGSAFRIPGGIATIEAAKQHLNMALSHLNTSVRMHDLALESNAYEHWLGYEEGVRECADELRKARDQLDFGGISVPMREQA